MRTTEESDGRPGRLAIVILLLAVAIQLRCRPPIPRVRPNIILLVMDTTRADRCSFNGYDRPTTPRLGELAAESTTFTNAWSPAGWTGPGHASLFTGLRPRHHGYVEGNRPFLDESASTLAEQLSDDGYATACFTNNAFVSAEYGLAQGFQLVEAMHERRHAPNPPSQQTHTEALAWALERQRRGEPFFLFINDIEPHVPYQPPPLIRQRFLRPSVNALTRAAAASFDSADTLAFNFGYASLERPVIDAISSDYDGEIATLDEQIGSFVDSLRESGILDDALLIVTSDHGENLGEHALFGHHFSLHRSIRHIPLMVRHPQRFAAGAVVEDVVRLEDVAPTVLEVAGLPVEDGLDGESLLGELGGRIAIGSFGVSSRWALEITMRWPDADLSLLETAIEAVFDGEHHLIRHSDGREELYDHRVDSGETDNIVASHQEIAYRLRGRLDRPWR